MIRFPWRGFVSLNTDRVCYMWKEDKALYTIKGAENCHRAPTCSSSNQVFSLGEALGKAANIMEYIELPSLPTALTTVVQAD